MVTDGIFFGEEELRKAAVVAEGREPIIERFLRE